MVIEKEAFMEIGECKSNNDVNFKHTIRVRLDSVTRAEQTKFASLFTSLQNSHRSNYIDNYKNDLTFLIKSLHACSEAC